VTWLVRSVFAKRISALARAVGESAFVVVARPLGCAHDINATANNCHLITFHCGLLVEKQHYRSVSPLRYRGTNLTFCVAGAHRTARRADRHSTAVGTRSALDPCMTIRFAVFLTLACASCRAASGEELGGETARVTHNVVESPCSGCTVDLPSERTEPERSQPLLVVLHGNNEPGSAAAARWRDAALAHGFAVVGLHCPRDRGCTDGKWYAWRETPSFVLESLAAIQRDMRIDPARTYLAGWSGGASAIGQHLGAWAPFSAIVIHGGGQRPAKGECPAHATPAYFLVGDGNPDHAAAIALRDHLATCAGPIEWDVLAHAGHADEKRALDRDKGEHILDWLDSHTASALAAR